MCPQRRGEGGIKTILILILKLLGINYESPMFKILFVKFCKFVGCEDPQCNTPIDPLKGLITEGRSPLKYVKGKINSNEKLFNIREVNP